MERRRGLMVALAAIVVGIAAGAPPPMDPDMAELAKAVRDSCAAESAVDVRLVERINEGADLTPEPTLKCYIKCTMETAGMMADGSVDVEAVLALLPDELRAKNEQMLRGCGTASGGDHCEIAYNTQVCWQKGNKDDYFLI